MGDIVHKVGCLTQKNQTTSTIFQVLLEPLSSLFKKNFLKKVELMTRNEIKSNFELFFFSNQTSLFVSTFSAVNYAYYEPANQFSASGPVNHRLFELVTDRGVWGGV